MKFKEYFSFLGSPSEGVTLSETVKPICALCQKPVDQFMVRDAPAISSRIFWAQCHGRWEERAATNSAIESGGEDYIVQLTREWFQEDRRKQDAASRAYENGKADGQKKVNGDGKFVNYSTGVSSIVLREVGVFNTIVTSASPLGAPYPANYREWLGSGSSMQTEQGAKSEQPKPELKKSVVDLQPKKRMITLEE